MSGQSRLLAGTGTNAELDELLDELGNRLQAGESLVLEDIIREHPEHEEGLRRYFPALQVLANLNGTKDGTALLGELGDFRLLREVGRGGMGMVYEAEQISLRRRVALKVLPFAATMDHRHLQRFHNEAQAAACLHHTNIVPVFSVGCERGVHFYAMQFIDGQPLSELIRQMRSLENKNDKTPPIEATSAYSPPEGAITTSPTLGQANASTPLTDEGRRGRDYYRKVAELGIQAAEALDHAHQLGIVHRDIKPANLLVDGAGRLWVTDFGLAHMQHNEASLTQTGQAMGTPRYMSPEQALAKRVPIDHRTDVYSLGVTLYELLTLRPAFASEDRQELLRQIAFEDPIRPRRLERAIPAELEIIVLKAMEKRPQDRYATAQELADDLERWLKHETIRARRPSLLHRCAKWGRRHKHAVTASALVLLMVLVLAGYIGLVRHDQTLRRAASEQVILAALEESKDWQEKRRLPEALSAARRANGVLVGVEVNDSLSQQVRARLADLELLERLENVRLESMTQVRGRYFDFSGADILYGRTFGDAGLDLESLPTEEAAERIRRTTVAVELASVLDHWAWHRQWNREIEDSNWKHFLRVARLADPDIWRTRVREAWESKDFPALRALASSEEVWNLPPATLYILGYAFQEDSRFPGQKQAFLREAQRRFPSDFWLNQALYVLLSTKQPPQWEEAFHFAAVSVALRPESPGARLNLGHVLHNKGQLNEAIAEYREAIRIQKDYVSAYNNLGIVLQHKGQLDQAIDAYREAIRIKKDQEVPHYNLARALEAKGQWDESIVEYREAIGLKKDDLEARCNLGVVLRNKGRLDDAIAEFREAIRIKKDHAGAHLNLGRALVEKGQFNEAVEELRLGHNLASRDPSWRFPSAQWVRDAERKAALDSKLTAVLEGKEKPADAAERIIFAELCYVRQRYAAAARFFREAFDLQNNLAKDRIGHHLGNGAMCAALAGCGAGKDAPFGDTERAQLRRCALVWLQEVGQLVRESLNNPASEKAEMALNRVTWLINDPDLNCVRGPDALAKLPEAERREWQKLWAEVEALRKRAATRR